MPAAAPLRDTGNDTSQSLWDAVDLVVFDVDGTLYDQRRMRVSMASRLLLHTAATRSRRTVRVISCYRRLREEMGDNEVADFEPALIARTAAAANCPKDVVHTTVAEWMDERPLPFLRACRFPGLPDVFSALRRRAKQIGILSDYPVVAKLSALELDADYAVSAGEEGIGILKPHPKGLQTLIDRAGASPSRTMLVGDRVERDGEAAKRIGAQSLIKSSRPIPGWRTFRDYRAAPFDVLLDE